MTKAELVELAKSLDIEVDEGMTKAEIQELIAAKEAELDGSATVATPPETPTAAASDKATPETETATADTPPPGSITPGSITVVGPKAGRRRAGFQFGPAPVIFLRGSISEDVLAQLRADPLLSVSETA